MYRLACSRLLHFSGWLQIASLSGRMDEFVAGLSCRSVYLQVIGDTMKDYSSIARKDKSVRNKYEVWSYSTAMVVT